MAFDFTNVSTDVVEIPDSAVRRWVEYKPSPFDVWFTSGITPEGKGYMVPGNAKDQEWRKALTGELNRAQLHYNSEVLKPGDPPLSYRQNITKAGVIVSVVYKTTKSRKNGNATPTESAKSGAPVVRGSANGSTTKRAATATA